MSKRYSNYMRVLDIAYNANEAATPSMSLYRAIANTNYCFRVCDALREIDIGNEEKATAMLRYYLLPSYFKDVLIDKEHYELAVAVIKDRRYGT